MTFEREEATRLNCQPDSLYEIELVVVNTGEIIPVLSPIVPRQRERLEIDGRNYLVVEITYRVVRGIMTIEISIVEID